MECVFIVNKSISYPPLPQIYEIFQMFLLAWQSGRLTNELCHHHLEFVLCCVADAKFSSGWSKILRYVQLKEYKTDPYLKFNGPLFLYLRVLYKLRTWNCFCFDLQNWWNNFMSPICTKHVNQQRIGQLNWRNYGSIGFLFTLLFMQNNDNFIEINCDLI